MIWYMCKNSNCDYECTDEDMDAFPTIVSGKCPACGYKLVKT